MNRLINISLIALILLASCQPSDSYIDLSENAKELIKFELGDTFQLKNLITDEIIELEIISKDIRYVDGSGPSTGTILDAGGDTYYERGTFRFSDQSNCYSVSVLVEARSNGNFEFSIGTGDCFGEYLSTTEFNSLGFEYNGEITNINVNGVEYSETYVLETFNTAFTNTIFYTKENGIVQIFDNQIQSAVFTIAE
ncbi:hypothetical protein [Psychroflexus montanilacus]|uniref:hypothetical protein n=1 Tax=Psychroflexus montanilacus TaxID=2873598 RepID=UPI001CCAE6B1|nr:hypothetical protein [Psychroflexus montanilacus]MBZ9651588.1 hypothetical protein [Psychroflexus montanilacus]